MPSGFPSYILIGVGVALSVLGFFLKKLKIELDACNTRLMKSEISLARQEEKFNNLEKVVEDRRRDVKDLYQRTNPPFKKS